MEQFKKVTIERCVIKNFRAIKNIDFEFDSVESVITGPNGVGKSTILSAWLYLFTGYDSAHQADYEIKPRNAEGKTQKQVVPTVHFFLDIEGRKVDLRKEMHEVWKPKSEDDPEEVFDSNTFKYFENGVEKKTKKAFQETLDGIIPSAYFEVMSNADYFLRLEQKELRRIILDLVGGEISDEELLELKPEYAKLISILKHKTVEVYQKEIKSSLTAAEAQKKRLPALIESKEADILKLPTEKEFLEVEAAITEKKEEVLLVRNKIAGKSTGDEFDIFEQKKTLLSSLKGDLDRYKLKFEGEVSKANSEIDSKKIPLQGKVKTTNALIDQLNRENDLKRSRISTIDLSLAQWKKDWFIIDAKVFEPAIIPEEGEELPVCKTCGQPIGRDILIARQATEFEDFNTKNIDDKLEIQERGKTKVAEKVTIEAEIVANDSKISAYKKDVEAIQKELDEIIPDKRKVEEDKDFITMVAEIAEREEEIANPPKADTEDLVLKEAELTEQIDTLNQTLGKREVLEDAKKDLDNLNDQVVSCNREVLQLKKVDKGIVSYLKDRSTILEEKVNKKFSIIKWELFDYKNDGTPVLACNPTIDGARYKALNTAKKSWAQIDVAKTFSEKTGILAPIFLDNQESVGWRPETQSQVINIEFFKYNKDRKFEVLNDLI